MTNQVFEQVKSALRITHNKFDDIEIKPLIDQAREDLKAGGVPEAVADSDCPLVIRAIIHYARLNFPLDGIPNHVIARYERAYASSLKGLAIGRCRL